MSTTIFKTENIVPKELTVKMLSKRLWSPMRCIISPVTWLSKKGIDRLNNL